MKEPKCRDCVDFCEVKACEYVGELMSGHDQACVFFKGEEE